MPQGKVAAEPSLKEPTETPQSRSQGVILRAEGKEGGNAEV